MEKNFRPSNDAALEKAKAIAGSPAGQQLYAMLQQRGGQDFQKAMVQASTGDIQAAKQVLSKLMESPDAQELLRQLGR